MASRPVLRWALPAGVVVAVAAAGAVSTALRASADVTLPERSAAQLLVDVQTADVAGAYGTVVATADLGLPALPEGIGGQGSSQLNSLVSGSHTLRVWYSGPDKARVALLGALGESDVIRNGTDVWTWSSQNNTATHSRLGAERARPGPRPTDLPTSPQQAADEALEALDPSTTVTTEPSDTVAGRGTYELALTPKDTGSLVAKVRIGIDGSQHIPTRVQVYAKGSTKPSVEIAFSSVTFKRPDNGVFAFSPPPGAKIDDQTGTAGAAKDRTERTRTALIGQGWTSVLAARMPTGTPDASNQDRGSMDAFLNTLPRVHGTWGSGRLLRSKLFSALITDDGRVLAGAVTGDQLQKAAADPRAALK